MCEMFKIPRANVQRFQRRCNADKPANVVGMLKGGFGDFSGDIQTHCSLSFLRCCMDNEPGSVCIGVLSSSHLSGSIVKYTSVGAAYHETEGID